MTKLNETKDVLLGNGVSNVDTVAEELFKRKLLAFDYVAPNNDGRWRPANSAIDFVAQSPGEIRVAVRDGRCYVMKTAEAIELCEALLSAIEDSHI